MHFKKKSLMLRVLKTEYVLNNRSNILPLQALQKKAFLEYNVLSTERVISLYDENYYVETFKGILKMRKLHFFSSSHLDQ